MTAHNKNFNIIWLKFNTTTVQAVAFSVVAPIHKKSMYSRCHISLGLIRCLILMAWSLHAGFPRTCDNAAADVVTVINWVIHRLLHHFTYHLQSHAWFSTFLRLPCLLVTIIGHELANTFLLPLLANYSKQTILITEVWLNNGLLYNTEWTADSAKDALSSWATLHLLPGATGIEPVASLQYQQHISSNASEVLMDTNHNVTISILQCLIYEFSVFTKSWSTKIHHHKSHLL